MDYPEFRSMTPEQLRTYIDAHREGEYLLIDVRQPQEYTAAHIPGSRLMPLMELQTKIFDLPADRELVFYCHSGGRSTMAADLAAEAEVTEKPIYNLSGGMMAWDGQKLEDFPKVQIFDKSRTLPELLMTAMNLEKGAFSFYSELVRRYENEAFAETFRKLSEAETAHAKSVYRFWQKTESQAPEFETLFDQLDGKILEGGETLDAALERVKNIRGDICINLMEMALHIEYSAFDLYRTMADQSDDPEAAKVFLAIAQAEKSHMQTLAQAVPECSGS